MSIQEYCQRKILYKRRTREIQVEGHELIENRKQLLLELAYSPVGSKVDRLRKVLLLMSLPLHWCVPSSNIVWRNQTIVHRLVYQDLEVSLFECRTCFQIGFGAHFWSYETFMEKHNVLRTYFALCRIQRAVRRWLEQPTYSNGHVGFHARKSWEEACRFRDIHEKK